MPEQEAWRKARSAEFWKGIHAGIESLSRETCEEIVRLGKEFGVAMNTIAAVMMRRQIGMAWNDRYDVGVGRNLYLHALEVLDQHDSDFRPAPSREMIGETEDDAGTRLKIFYLTHRQEFEVEVSRGERVLREAFRAGVAPRFGIDASDNEHAFAVGERLAAKLDEEDRAARE